MQVLQQLRRRHEERDRMYREDVAKFTLSEQETLQVQEHLQYSQAFINLLHDLERDEEARLLNTAQRRRSSNSSCGWLRRSLAFIYNQLHLRRR